MVAGGGEVIAATGDVRALVYAPYSFSGRGPAESCAQIAGGMVATGLRTEVFAGRARTPLPEGVTVRAPFPAVTSRLPWRRVERPALRMLDRQFLRAVATADPRSTVAHFWPGTPGAAVEAARERGIVTVREMINSACATAGPLLDAAYARLGMPPAHAVTKDVIDGETAELRHYDYYFASNPEVERSLLALDIRPEQILPTSFGWRPERFDLDATVERPSGFQAVFVGRIGVRKGVPELLEAWASLDVDGELVLVGAVDDEIRELVDAHTRSGRVRLAGYVENPAALYAGSDVFVFPTWEEGGPQVTYEAAACGLPVVTTPMGAARLVEDGRTGVVVEPGSVAQLASAIRLLADDAEIRRTYAAAAQAAAARFTYGRVGAQRAELLRGALHARAVG
ncbi:glycosyltransferase [Cellulomonas humilata]|uniref:glycosyltransferase n=1 Tax=Cellulomonas humilata TaxID=144055 RepID=UPI0027D84E71|nr:glycosyltransferase [Cellulomonas humilata]